MNNTTPSLDFITVESAADCDACIIWLHGLGASGHDFAGITPQLHLPPHAKWRFIFPHAPVRPVTLNGGMPMPAWFDIISLDRCAQADQVGINNSQQAIMALIDQQIAQGIASQRIVLAGFSQGGALALVTGLRYHRPLAGLLVLSSYLPIQDGLLPNSNSSNQHTPILQTHGTRDQILPLALGLATAEYLTNHHYPLTFKQYPMAHEVCHAQLDDIATWLKAQLQ